MMAITTNIPTPVISSKGYLRPSILWHLLEEGTATLADLQRLIGCPRSGLSRQLQCMRTLGQVMCPPRTDGGDLRVALYSLTPAGIEAALRVNLKDVEFSA